MQFINNWSRAVTLAAGATSLALDLPDGEYRLTITDSQFTPTRWEIVGATVAVGTATLVRGLEGTTDQEWPAGSVIYLSVTAGLLSDIFARLSALEGGGEPAQAPMTMTYDTSLGGNDVVIAFLDAQEITIDWGDGATDTLSGYYYDYPAHSYAAAGIYAISISGSVSAIGDSGAAGIAGLIAIESFGDLPLTDISNLCRGASNLVAVPVALPVGLLSMNQTFMACSSLNDPNVSGWDVSSVTGMDWLFRDAAIFDQDLSGWCVASVPTEPPLFADGAALTEAHKPIWGTCPA